MAVDLLSASGDLASICVCVCVCVCVLLLTIYMIIYTQNHYMNFVMLVEWPIQRMMNQLWYAKLQVIACIYVY